MRSAKVDGKERKNNDETKHVNRCLNHQNRSFHAWKKRLFIARTSSDSVLEGTLVEDVRRKSAERRVHTVLHLEADGSDAQHHQPLKQRLRKACFSCLFTHHHWSQLAVISHQNQLMGG